MIPTIVATEIRETLLDYLRTTWSLSDPALEKALFAYLRGGGDNGGGIFRGPYLRLRLPFQPAARDARIPLDIPIPYTPHQHQLEAWQRLSCRDGTEPKPTLVVTGTGSGKTEAFLYPIVDHCLRARRAGERGIKAIILYPMNALAADQARRIAELIWGPEDGEQPMRGKLDVGMYVGGEGAHRMMGRDHVIDVGKQLVVNPPDVLLTNYKMLDFLLLRPKDRDLWKNNRPETLKYLVLDELHTYDGAQGTDVACLIRRLGARLGSTGGFCPVGTSATVASEDDQGDQRLLDFAARIFGVDFDPAAIVGETRRSPASFFGLFPAVGADRLPDDTEALEPRAEDSIEDYVGRAAGCWFADLPRLRQADGGPDRGALGEVVVRLPLVRKLIELSSARLYSLSALDEVLATEHAGYGERARPARLHLLQSLLAMISWAQDGNDGPLLSVQVQLWVREVRRLVREVGLEPRFAWRDEQPARKGEPLSLPMYHCRSCGHSGWITVISPLGSDLERNYARVGEKYLQRSEDIVYLHCDARAYDEEQLPGVADYVCPRCAKRVASERCIQCQGPTVAVFMHRAVSSKTPPKDMQRCPACGTDWALSMLASRAASLASVAVGHLYTTPFNSDRKLLAFSDSVQDASHRAGFFSGRTYRFSLRSAMLAAVPAEGALPLVDVAEVMLQAAGGADPGRVLATFMPHDLEWLESYQKHMDDLERWGRERAEADQDGRVFKRKIPTPPGALMTDLFKRLRWEVTREFSLAARIGRTLERTGCASALVDAERFDAAVALLESRVPPKLGATEGVESEAWRHFLAGFIARLRLRGGVYDDLLRLYFERNGSGAYLSKKEVPLLSPFGRRTSRPLFLTSDSDSERFDSVLPGKRHNWYSEWARRALGLDLLPRDGQDLYLLILPLLVDSGLLRVHALKRRTTWGLDPKALHVARAVDELACDVCGLEHTSVVGARDSLRGAPCLRFRCPGRFKAAQEADPGAEVRNYYRRFYQRQEMGRVWATEHTGLLEREYRESVEAEFKQRYRPDSPNMLSCTPTLEMGIDIGDLSATMLISVPPTPASYLQRVGRAGRKTGNALVLTFSTTTAHDLYFFDEPEAAMAGPVQPPGCYLDAPEILKRQALAWCLDAWAKEATEEQLPPQVRQWLRGEEKKRFPQPLFDFIQSRREQLRESFLEVFATSTNTREELTRFMSGTVRGGSALEQRLAQLVEDVVRQRKELVTLRDRVRERIKAIEAEPKKTANADEEKKELIQEVVFLDRQLTALHDRGTLAYLCERSLLPNYAFPETGVTLRAFIAKDQAGGAAAGAERHEWVRAARVAIRELAPFNTFYGMARRVKVNNIDVGSRVGAKKGDQIERWQLCGSCGFMAPEPRAKRFEQCPRCNAGDWREQGRLRAMVEMRTVSAFARQREAAFSDESEDRDRTYFETERFFDHDEGMARDAWLDADGYFGFELLPRLTVREINFGPRRRASGSVRIGGRTVPDVSFLVCEECGQVKDPTQSQQNPAGEHRRYCGARYKPVDKQPWRPLHLFRQMQSEALRMVLPIGMMQSQEKLANMRAALQLGLRRFFGGDPQHLQVDSYDEPTALTEGARIQYVVVHDVVPGGTGVLAELAAAGGTKLRRVLELSKAAIETCPCTKRGTEVRGCYRCIYAHRLQRDLPVLDRDEALALLKKLLSSFARLKSVPTISGLEISSMLESELERMFIARLGDWAAEQADVSWDEVEPERWELRLGARRWRVEPQVELDEGQDVAIRCRPDFVFWPLDAGADVLPVAVFLDGFSFHVQPNKARARVGDDFAKREAILRSGRFRVWSISWHDIQAWSGSEQDVGPWMEQQEVRRQAEQVARSLGEDLADIVRAGLKSEPMTTFINYLRNPAADKWISAAVVGATAAMLTGGRASEPTTVAALATRLREDKAFEPLLALAQGGAELHATLRVGGNRPAVCLLSADGAKLGKAMQQPEVISAVLRLDDSRPQRETAGYLQLWRQFLRAHNLFQFLPRLRTVTTEQLLGAEEDQDAVLVVPAPTALRAAEDRRGYMTDSIREEIDGADPRVKEVLEPLYRDGFGLPEMPFEFGSGSAEDGLDVIVLAGWPAAQVALAGAEEAEDARSLRGRGWVVIEVEDGIELEAVRKALTERTGG